MCELIFTKPFFKMFDLYYAADLGKKKRFFQALIFRDVKDIFCFHYLVTVIYLEEICA